MVLKLPMSAFLCAFRLLIVIFVSTFGQHAQAQGISVSPIKLEAEVPTGRGIQIPFTIANTNALEGYEMTVQHVELLQGEGAEWLFQQTEDIFDPEKHQSNKSWFDDIDQVMSIGPDQNAPLLLTGVVPRNARGTSFSALLVTSEPKGDADAAVRLKFQFLVPIILTASGRAARQDIELVGLDLKINKPSIAAGPDQKETVDAQMWIENNGKTYGRLSGDIRVEREEANGWRNVTAMPIPERGIIPGSRLGLRANLGRHLPSGMYRLTGTLKIDGRRLPRMTEVIEFEGDPNLTALSYDAIVSIDPSVIEIGEVRAGAARNQVISITNPTTEQVEVILNVKIPPELENVAIGDLIGNELSAANWVRVSPPKLRIRPNASRNVRMVVRSPVEVAQHSNFYAVLEAQSLSADGQEAGKREAKVIVSSENGRPMSKLAITEFNYAQGDEPDIFVVNAQIANIGSIHADPKIRAQLIEIETEKRTPLVLEGGDDIMLPFATWEYAGLMDIGVLPDGDFALRVDFDYGGSLRETRELPITISTNEEGQKLLSETVAVEESEEVDPELGDRADAATE